MKAREVKMAGFTAATVAELTTAVGDWLAAAGEKEFVDAKYAMVAGEYTVLIFYME